MWAAAMHDDEALGVRLAHEQSVADINCSNPMPRMELTPHRNAVLRSSINSTHWGECNEW
jgi:hypothetical protein